METIAKGNATEAAVIKALIEHDFPVLIPFGEGQPYDLLVDLGDRFARIQCKTGRPVGEVIMFNSCSSDHGRGRGTYEGLADLFGVYFKPTDCVFLVPVGGAASYVTSLRLAPARNNQRSRIRLATDYEIGQWTKEELIQVVESASTGIQSLSVAAG